MTLREHHLHCASVERVRGTSSGENGCICGSVRVRNGMGISIYIRNVATESEVAGLHCSTATPSPRTFIPLTFNSSPAFGLSLRIFCALSNSPLTHSLIHSTPFLGLWILNYLNVSTCLCPLSLPSRIILRTSSPSPVLARNYTSSSDLLRRSDWMALGGYRQLERSAGCRRKVLVGTGPKMVIPLPIR
jgi:hypothetical protein